MNNSAGSSHPPSSGSPGLLPALITCILFAAPVHAQQICFDRAEFEPGMAFTVYDSVHFIPSPHMLAADSAGAPVPQNDIAVWEERWTRVDSSTVWLFAFTVSRWDVESRVAVRNGQPVRPRLNRCYLAQRSGTSRDLRVSPCDPDQALGGAEVLLSGDPRISRWPEIMMRVFRHRCLADTANTALLNAFAAEIEETTHFTVSDLTLEWHPRADGRTVSVILSWMHRRDFFIGGRMVTEDRSIMLDCTLERGSARLLQLRQHQEIKCERPAGGSDSRDLDLSFRTEVMRVTWEPVE